MSQERKGIVRSIWEGRAVKWIARVFLVTVIVALVGKVFYVAIRSSCSEFGSCFKSAEMFILGIIAVGAFAALAIVAIERAEW